MTSTLNQYEDREDAYDPTDLLECVQDCGQWPMGDTTTRLSR